MAVLPLDQFLCWKLKTAIIATASFIVVAGALAFLLELLDIVALRIDSFEINGSFEAHWRAHVWEGWLATNIVMMFCHLLLGSYSVMMYFAVKRFPTYYEYSLTKGYLALIIMYFLVELGIGLYRYSWYGANTFRLPYLVFTFLYWIIRSMMYITGAFIVGSRISELGYEIKYGEKKNLDPYQSHAALLDQTLRSGTATPVPRGMGQLPQSTSSYA